MPTSVVSIVRRLHRRGYEAYVVGGAVRDLVLGRTPKDWDVATNARPERIETLFPRTIPTGKVFGTITVFSRGDQVQVTTFRSEGNYHDRRRPSAVEFVGNLEGDLSRRDFTMNAMALDLSRKRVIDPYGGLQDLRNKKLKAVGKAVERFQEDTLRAVRAGRFLAELRLRPSPSISSAARAVSPHVRELSGERIRDELVKLLHSPRPSLGFLWLDRVKILEIVLPEVTRGKRVYQGGWHAYDVFRHTLEAVDAGPADLVMRLALLFHDIAKPITRTRDKKGFHFYQHDRLGAEMAGEILRRLRFSNAVIEDVTMLVRHHLFEAETISKTDAAVRRFMRRVGEDQVPRLLDFRSFDVKGCGPGRKVSPALRKIELRARKIQKAREALSLKDLKIDGDDVMKWLKIAPGPRVGEILKDALEYVLSKPSRNRRSDLRAHVLSREKSPTYS